MPELCRFMGMVITMYHDEHPPPHFHVRYGAREVQVLLTGEIYNGRLPYGQRRLIRKWARLHHSELERCWARAIRQEPPGTIEPLS